MIMVTVLHGSTFEEPHHPKVVKLGTKTEELSAIIRPTSTFGPMDRFKHAGFNSCVLRLSQRRLCLCSFQRVPSFLNAENSHRLYIFCVLSGSFPLILLMQKYTCAQESSLGGRGAGGRSAVRVHQERLRETKHQR